MTNWLAVVPEILFVVAVLGVPGFLVALCLRLRAWDALGLSVPLSLGLIAAASVLSTASGIPWGLPVIAGTAAGFGAVVLGSSALLHRFGRRPTDVAQADLAESFGWSRRQHLIAVAATLGAGLVGVVAIARGMGTPDALNQTFDGAFHVNSIGYIAERHFAGPSVFAQLGDPAATHGFYPPTFSATASLLVMYFGLNPVIAGNAAALAIAFVWPWSVSIMLRRFVRPTVFGYLVAMMGAVTVGLFPALLIERTVWPNALSVLSIGPALVLVLRLAGLDRSKADPDRSTDRLPWVGSAVALVIIALGMAFVHPSALFGTFYLALPIAAWFVWKRIVPPAASRLQRVAAAMGLFAASIGAVAAVIWLAYLSPSLRGVADFYWPPTEPWGTAIVQVLALTSRQSHANLSFGLLVIIGMWFAAKTGRGRVLLAGWAIIAMLCAFTSGVQSTTTMYMTGFWYSDAARIFALVPVVTLPLAALGADAARSWLTTHFTRRREAQGHGPKPLTSGVLAAGLVCILILVLQGGLGTARISHTVLASYRWEHGLLVSPGQKAMFGRLAVRLGPDETIAGNPFTGEILAGVVSGRQVIYPVFGRPQDPVRAAVALNFDRYTSDRVVCAAVKSLKIKIVVTGMIYNSQTPTYHAPYRGFDRMAKIRGLTKIDSGGGATAYRVGDCDSTPYVDGPLLTAGQEQLFKRLPRLIPAGVTIAGSPYMGEIFAGSIRNAVVFSAFGTPKAPDQRLVARSFRTFVLNPIVCAAVKRLKIGAVVTGPTYGGVGLTAMQPFAGFHRLGGIPGLGEDDLASVAGLTKLDSGGGATAYRVGDCISAS